MIFQNEHQGVLGREGEPEALGNWGEAKRRLSTTKLYSLPGGRLGMGNRHLRGPPSDKKLKNHGEGPARPENTLLAPLPLTLREDVQAVYEKWYPVGQST